MEQTPHVHHEHEVPASAVKANKSNMLMAAGAVALILIVLAVVNFGGMLKGGKKLSPDEAKAKAETYINANLVSGTTASITEVTDYSSTLYKLAVKVGDTSIDSYITKDGAMFFPQAMDTSETVAAADGGTDTAAATPVVAADIPKSDKPAVEVFVMSRCPYGTQMEKGLLPVMSLLKGKADIKIKFVDYVMHGDAELKGNIAQYCIDKEENGKYEEYLKCYLKSGDLDACVTSTGVNKKKLDSCLSATDKQFKLNESFTDKTKWTSSFPPFAIHEKENKAYGVQGSPTFVVNGKQVETSRSADAIKTTICAAFKNAPKECETKLDTATPSAGFGEGTASASDAAACAPS